MPTAAGRENGRYSRDEASQPGCAQLAGSPQVGVPAPFKVNLSASPSSVRFWLTPKRAIVPERGISGYRNIARSLAGTSIQKDPKMMVQLFRGASNQRCLSELIRQVICSFG